MGLNRPTQQLRRELLDLARHQEDLAEEAKQGQLSRLKP